VTRAALALAVSAAVLALAACGRERAPASPSASATKPNLLLITMDTTRADHLGCYGDARAETPNLDRLAKEGALFTHAIAVAPLTLPSHVSILTGLYPPRHGVRDNADFVLPASETTLAEHLAAQGYVSGASVGTYILAGEVGLSQGFDTYAEPQRPKAAPAGDPNVVRILPIVERAAARVVDDAIGALDRMKDKPFFLWVHFYDPHMPYLPPLDVRPRFANRFYDGEIAGMDAQIGRLLDHLRALGLEDRTLIAATADHGESLGEHGEDTHGLYVYDATLAVPLLVRLPSAIRAGTRVTSLVSGVDLAPTVLELMGLPPMPGVQGRSAAAAFRGETLPEREPVYAESLYGERAYGWAPLHAIRSSKAKFIDAPRPELYDLERDPAETINTAPARAAEASEWRSKLDAAGAAIGEADPSASAGMSEEQRARIASLGYASAGGPGLSRKDRPDPKDLAVVSNLFLRAQTAISDGHDAEASKLLREALAKDPANPAVVSLLGALEFTGNDRASGLARLRAAAVAAPSVFQNQWNLGNALFLDGKLDEGAKALRAALAIRPGSGEAHYALANVLAAKGDSAAAIAEYNEAIKAGLATPPVRAALGSTLLATGDMTGAEAALRAALDGDPALADGWNKLGILLDKTGRRDEALAAFSHAVESQPDHADGLFNRARLELLKRDLPAARRDIDRLIAAHPDYAAARFLEAHVLAGEGNTAGAREALTKFLAAPKADPGMRAAARAMLAKLGA